MKTPIFALALALLLLAGCESVRFSPPPRHLDHETKEDAMLTAYRAMRPGQSVIYVDGSTGSMRPYYWAPFFAVVELTQDWRRAPGRMVIRRTPIPGNPFVSVAHAAGVADVLGVITYGTACDRNDYGRMTERDMIGIVVATYHWRENR